MIVTFSYFFAWNLDLNDEETETATDDDLYEPFENETDEQLSAENQATSKVDYTNYLCKTQNCSKFYTICTYVEILCTLQTLTGKLQGRISTQGDPCSHYREWVYRVQLSSVMVTFFSLF